MFDISALKMKSVIGNLLFPIDLFANHLIIAALMYLLSKQRSMETAKH